MNEIVKKTNFILFSTFILLFLHSLGVTIVELNTPFRLPNTVDAHLKENVIDKYIMEVYIFSAQHSSAYQLAI